MTGDLRLFGRSLFGASVAICFGVTCQPAMAQNPNFRARCENVSKAPALNTLDAIESRFIPAGLPPPDAAERINAPSLLREIVPAHCKMTVATERRLGSNGKQYEIRLEMRVPQTWNGRLVVQGGGAFKGSVDPAFGFSVSKGSSASLALTKGYAVVTNDSGHTGFDASFTDDQLATLNFAYASIGKVTRASKLLLDRLEGRTPERTYFQGCSNGGREALMAAQRFPEEFDGVIAAAPAVFWAHDAILSYFSLRALSNAAPQSADRRGQPWLAFTLADWQLINRGITKQCDAADGIADGLIFNHSSCQFDPTALICRSGQTSGCLSADKVSVLEASFRSPPGEDDRLPLFDKVYDTGVGTNIWLSAQMGYVDETGQTQASLAPYLGHANPMLAQLFRYPAVTAEQLASETPQQMLFAMNDRMALIHPSSTQLDSFAARGGKLLLVHGWSDHALSPLGLVKWYEALKRDTASASKQSVDSFTRMFMVPGMDHCGGGKSLDDFDALSALTDWVENGTAPAVIEAGGAAFPGMTRPLCAFPRFARYKGSGDKSKAASFICSQ